MTNKYNYTDFKNWGTIYSIKDKIITVTGLSRVSVSEMVSDKNGNLGIVLNLSYNNVSVIMFEDSPLIAGDSLTRLYKVLNIFSDPFLILGSVLNPIGSILSQSSYFLKNSFSSLSIITGKIKRFVEVSAPRILGRQPVDETYFTGIMGIDGILPLGKGQRELIIGDRQTGKTTIALDIILNQSIIDILFFNYFSIFFDSQTIEKYNKK